MKIDAVHKQILDELSCQVPDCTHEGDEPLYLHSRCHVKEPLWCTYHRGVVTVECSKCKAVVIEIEVAP